MPQLQNRISTAANMMLTPEDRAAIAAIVNDVAGGLPGSSPITTADDIGDWLLRIYTAGLAAGMEREREACAKVCDTTLPRPDMRYARQRNILVCGICAAAIRERGTTPPPREAL